MKRSISSGLWTGVRCTRSFPAIMEEEASQRADTKDDKG